MKNSFQTKFAAESIINTLTPYNELKLKEQTISKLPTNTSILSQNFPQQENYFHTPMNTFKEALRVNFSKSFRLKVPNFPKRPFGKHDSLNNEQIKFVEMDIKDYTHNLYEKKNKFYKIICGRTSSVGRKRDRSKSFMKHPLYRLAL